MKPSIFMSGLFAVCAAALAACDGANGSNQPAFINVLVQPTPTASPTPPVQASATRALTPGTPVTFPTPAGFGGSWTVQAPGSNVPDGTTVTVTLTNAVPTGVTALNNTIVYVGLKANTTMSVGGGSVFTTTIPRFTLAPNTLLAFQGYNAGAWGLFAGTSSLPADNSTTLTTFTVPNAFSLTANTQYWFALTVGASSSTSVS